MEQDIAAQVVGLGGASDFSLWSLFLRADFVVNTGNGHRFSRNQVKYIIKKLSQ